MEQKRYTLVRLYHKQDYFSNIGTEKIACKTLKEANELGELLTNEEKKLGSHILDNVTNKKIQLK